MSQQAPTSESPPLPTTPEQLFDILQVLDIKYELHRHEPVFTVEESQNIDANIAGIHCRNLFLRDKKKKMFLVVAANETALDMKKLPEFIGSSRISFGSAARLWEFLGIRPGSVCPFCAINDKDHQVKIILDAYMMAGEVVNYHPLDNAMTVSLSPADLLKFFGHTGHEAHIVDLSAAAPD